MMSDRVNVASITYLQTTFSQVTHAGVVWHVSDVYIPYRNIGIRFCRGLPAGRGNGLRRRLLQLRPSSASPLPVTEWCWAVYQSYQFGFICLYMFLVRGAKPGKNVQLQENEIRGLCLKSREIFLSQPILLELEAPLKICGKGSF